MSLVSIALVCLAAPPPAAAVIRVDGDADCQNKVESAINKLFSTQDCTGGVILHSLVESVGGSDSVVEIQCFAGASEEPSQMSPRGRRRRWGMPTPRCSGTPIAAR